MASTKRATGVANSNSKKARFEDKRSAQISSANRGMIQGVSEALELSTISDDARRMLQAACPFALGAPADERHQLQQLAVELIGEALSGAQGKLVERLECAEKEASSVEASREQLCHKLYSEEEFLEVKQAKSKQRADELAAALAKHSASTSALAELRSSHQAAEKETKALQTKRERLGKALVHLEALRSEELSAGVLQAKCIGILAVVDGGMIEVDETLKSTLPRIIVKTKAERGSFDDMVLSELQTVLGAAAAKLQGEIAEDDVEVAERERQVAQATRKLEEENATCTSCRDLAKTTASECAAQKAAVEQQRKVIADFDTGAASTLKARESAQCELESFKTWPLECFTMLRDRNGRAVEAASAGA